MGYGTWPGLARVGVLLVALLCASLAARPAAAQDGVRAADLSPAANVADCSASLDSSVRYFVSVRSSAGTDITNAVGRLIGTGTANAGTVVKMFNGDLESQANDGIPPSCRPARNDGHYNDLGSTYVRALRGTDTWSLAITAPGYNPSPLIDLSSAVVGLVCPVGPRGCLISLGTIQLTPLSGLPGRGILTGSVFTARGGPLFGAAVLLIDFSGNVHQRTTGQSCGDTLAIGTGLYCFNDSDLLTSGTNGLGLPVGPARLVVVDNSSVPAGGCAPGTVCGHLPAFTTVFVATGQPIGRDITLQNKLAPAAAPSGAGAFGYVINGWGRGIGGYTVTATAVGAPTVTATSAMQTGLWAMSGLVPNTTYAFTLSGPGVVDSNVRPARTANKATGAGHWIDLSFVVTLEGIGNLPPPGFGPR